MKYFEETDYRSLNGIQKVQLLLEMFVTLYTNHKDFLRFIEEFDNYILKEKISPDRLEVYEQTILNLRPYMMEALEEGKRDGSIGHSIHNEQFYMTITHTLISLCQKMISRNTILNSDREIEGKSQVKLVVQMAIHYISKQ
ncbi:hypothetical protein D3C77_575540 [compost metagenome]